MGGFWMDKETQEQLNLCLSRISVILSFGAHVALALCAEVRRSEDYSVRRGLVWLAYQLTDLAPKAALGQLYLDNSSSEQVLFAFWVPFLLLHLGLADNISAYSLEDNKLSIRKIAELFLQLLAAGYGAYKQKFMSSDGVLCSAFVIMLLLGFCKCAERQLALWLGGFARLRSSYKDKEARRFSTPGQIGMAELDDDYALLDAHGLLGISMAAFADYSVKLFEEDIEGYYPLKHPKPRPYSHWDDVVKVVEMELSLMYDMMYTKAAVIHTWRGYIIRLLSPPLTATALLLFHFHSKAGQKEVDINITYMLLIGTFLLDVRWLLRSLVSTWTYAFLQGTQCNLLKKTICCRREIWYGLRRFVFSLDPSRLSISSSGCLKLNKQITSHRMWSRTIGQHNLFHECTCGTPSKKIGWEDSPKGEPGIKSILQVICKDILQEIPGPSASPWPADYPYKWRRKFSDERLFGPEFDELVLTWQIATDIFFLCAPGSDESPEYKKIKAKIKMISNYLMFLVTKRPKMLPGLKLGSHYEDIKNALKSIWEKVDRSDLSGCRGRQEKLAEDLLHKEDMRQDHIYHKSTMLSEGTCYANVLKMLIVPQQTCYTTWFRICSQARMKEEYQRRLILLVPEFKDCALEELRPMVGWPLERMLTIILKSWVRLLIFASIRCSRDSHAEQLSCGGELTTVIWLLAEHSELVGYENPIRDYVN
nr:unnamed protein product [Triticum aestivum]